MAPAGAQVFLHPADNERLRIKLRDVISNPSPGPIVAFLTRPPTDPRPLADGDVLPVLDGLRVVHTPGHTPGSVCLHSPSRRFVIVGDLLQRARGHVTLPNYFFTDDMSLARRSISRLAALRVGAVVVPLDVNSTSEFIETIARRTRASAIVVSQQTKQRALPLELPLFEMELLCDQARVKQPLPKAPVSPDDLAEVVFTSGTTGDPKGTMLTHRNILSNSVAATQIFPIGPHQRLLSFIPLSHMFEQMAGFWCALIAGASVVYPTSRQPSVVRRTFRERQGSMILFPPAALRSLLLAFQRKAEQDREGELFARLRRIPRGV